MTEYLFGTYLTKLHYSFTSLLSLVIQETTDEGTIYNGCCLLPITVFLPKWEPTAANHHCSSYNNNSQLWRSMNHSLIITHTHILALLCWWSIIWKVSERIIVINLSLPPLKFLQTIWISWEDYQFLCKIKPQHKIYGHIFGRWKNFSLVGVVISIFVCSMFK